MVFGCGVAFVFMLVYNVGYFAGSLKMEDFAIPYWMAVFPVLYAALFFILDGFFHDSPNNKPNHKEDDEEK